MLYKSLRKTVFIKLQLHHVWLSCLLLCFASGLVKAQDVGIVSLVPIESRVEILTDTIVVQIRNFGAQTVGNLPLQMELFLDDEMINSASTTFEGMLEPNQDTSYVVRNSGLEFSNDGQYFLRAYTTFAGDVDNANDTSAISFYNFAAAIPPVREGFELAGPILAYQGTAISVVEGLEGWVHFATLNERLQLQRGNAENGRRAASLDNGDFDRNQLVLSADLSQYDTADTDPVRLYFSHYNEGDEENPEDQVFFRTNENDPWIELFSWNDRVLATWRQEGFNIDSALHANNLQYTSTFQLLFQQHDNFPFPSDGVDFDNVFLGKPLPQAPFNVTLSVEENTANTTLDTLIINSGSGLYEIGVPVSEGPFSIDPFTLEVTLLGLLDFETIVAENGSSIFTLDFRLYDVILRDSIDALVQIEVLDVDENEPVFTSPDLVSIPENTTIVQTVMASDENTFTLAIAGGDDGTLFMLDEASGTLTFKQAPDFENPEDSDGDNRYQVIVQATDLNGNNAMQTITITVTNVDDSPPVFTSASEVSVLENTTFVQTVMATAIGAVTYSIISGADEAFFTIDGSSGELSFRSAPNFEDPQDETRDNVYLVTIQATDVSNNQAILNLSVTVTDEDERVTSIDQGIIDKHDISVFPIPAQEMLYIATEQALDQTVEVVVLDLPGNRVYVPVEYNDNGLQLTVGHLAKGVYIALLQSGQVRVVLRFVKQ